MKQKNNTKGMRQVDVLYRSGQVEEAKKICKANWSKNIFKSYYIEMLFDEGKYAEAKKICLENLEDEHILSQYIKILTKNKQYVYAKKICNKHLNNETIVSQYVNILLLEKKYKEAKEFIEKHVDVEMIQGQYIDVMVYFNDYGKVEEIYTTYPYNKKVCLQYAKCMIKQGEFLKAKVALEKHILYPDVKILYDSIDPFFNNKSKSSTEIINNYISNNNYDLAKEYALKHINEPLVYDLYIKVLELERISKNKQRKQILKKEC